MGVMITLYCDEQVVTREEAAALIAGVQSITKEVLNKQDVFALTTKTSDFISSDPVEIFVQINSLKITDADTVADRLSEAISSWRDDTEFPHFINLNVIPLEWHARLKI